MAHILLNGATGRTGGLILDYALAQGYAVTALVRNLAKLTRRSPQLTIVAGSPTNLVDVRRALAGCDAVVSALSALPEADSFSRRKLPPPHTLATTMRHTIAAMQELGIRRIVTLSSIGVGDSRPYAPWYMRLIIQFTKFKLVFADHAQQETLLRQSGLDWVIARPVDLNDKTQLGKLVVQYTQMPTPFAISRPQLARFMVDSLRDDTYLHKAPLLAEAPLAR